MRCGAPFFPALRKGILFPQFASLQRSCCRANAGAKKKWIGNKKKKKSLCEGTNTPGLMQREGEGGEGAPDYLLID